MINSKHCYIIAEIGINHEGNINLACDLIKKAKKGGADAVKFQFFEAKTMAFKNSEKTKDQKKRTHKKESLYEMWKRMELSLKDLVRLKKEAKKNKLDFICSVFDINSLQIAKKIGLDSYKVASSDLTDVILLKELSKEKKPIILSTGMASLFEIEKALQILKNRDVYLLHCVSMYPVPERYINLKRMLSLKKLTKKIGFSDHTDNNLSSIQAISMGAKIIEKHFTYNKKKKGADHSISAETNDLKLISDYAKHYLTRLGNGKIEPSNKEKLMRNFFRKSFYYNSDLEKDSIIEEKNISLRRPYKGLEANKFKQIINKRLKSKVKLNQPVKYSDLTS
jgi:N,N'-diacetyllegionaminate synthase